MNYIDIAKQKVDETYPIILNGNPHISSLEAGTIMGTWAFSLPNRYRIIVDQERQLAIGVLPADVTRAWLNDCYSLPFRRRKTQLNRNNVLPIHATRGSWGDCSYVDIKGAYLTILSLGYDVEYIPNKYIAVDPIVLPDEIVSNKFCYSIAVAMSNTQISNISIMGKQHVPFTVKKFNLYSNPCLYALASDVLNAVASEALAVMGSAIKYVNTDGFVVESQYSEYLIRIIDSWGFKSRVKYEGSTMIGGVGAWKIGKHSTKRFDKGARDFTSELMGKSDRLWLKKRFTKLIAAVPQLTKDVLHD